MAAQLSVTVVVGVVAVLNLILTVGVIRRLKDHEQRFTELSADDGASNAQPSVGTAVPEFTAATTTGGKVTAADLRDGGLIGFFSVGCPPCAEQLPDFTRFLRAMDDTPALIVIEAPSPADAAAFLEVTGDLPVVLDGGDGLCKTFEVNRFPSMAQLSGGAVAANAHTVARLLTQVSG
ncbi:TlpA family protein [Actinoplanes lobatus]|uniref:Peroxiredoxin n=1 Tax=Actinoplanes lobatus TaxID=113568 RepID=A0A7W7MGX4_9ACTN|nr:TlpA disulfide reductase family protein [Actinoplanes lobatus]MBB4749731.1 peroxiredoxin [Actinoplanes lobatus]GGN75975.1 TlpA family protein [Actinoplanes lobatus]GIE38469.1 TlpA family protein [Actinoplanes lobatus]